MCFWQDSTTGKNVGPSSHFRILELGVLVQKRLSERLRSGGCKKSKKTELHAKRAGSADLIAFRRWKLPLDAWQKEMPIQDSNQGIQKAEMNQNLIC
jgi:hypothetical protein